jgi:hypothetical protein
MLLEAESLKPIPKLLKNADCWSRLNILNEAEINYKSPGINGCMWS